MGKWGEGCNHQVELDDVDEDDDEQPAERDLLENPLLVPRHRRQHDALRRRDEAAVLREDQQHDQQHVELVGPQAAHLVPAG
tara:strand:- start:438 stop:683 length:246 start_codon:yes stop_codon:yes gene_type:complete